MRIAVVGGLERHETEVRRRASSHGHEVEWHSGHMHGRASDELEAMVERSDLAVIVTSVNSHGAVTVAKRALRRHPRPSLIVRTFGPSRFNLLLDAIDRRDSTAQISAQLGG